MQRLDDFLWTPSLRDFNAGSPEHAAPGAFADEPNNAADLRDADRDASGPAWRCVACDSTDCEPILGGWECIVCGSQEFYDPSAPTRSVTETGTWVYMPHCAPDPAAASSPSSSRSSQHSRRRRRKRHPGLPPSHDGGSEFAESETMTHDPTVDPSEPLVWTP